MALTLEYLNSETFATNPSPPQQWLWDGYLAPGMVTLFTSRWKSGKTTLNTVLLSKMGQGGSLAGTAVAPGNAIVVSEEPKGVWEERQKFFGYHPGIKILCRPFRGRPTMGEWVEFMAELASQRPALVVIDPLSKFLPGSVENNAIELQDALDPMHRLTDAGIAVEAIHHPTKKTLKGELSPRGSGALTAFADILVELDRPSGSAFNDRRRTLKVDSRLRPSTRTLIEWTDDRRDYAVLPEPIERDGYETGCVILIAMLEDAPSRISRKELLKYWPEDFDKPSPATLGRWLDRAVNERRIEVRGTGRFRNPYQYSIPGRKFDLDSLPPMDDIFAMPGPKKNIKELIGNIRKAFG